MRPEDIEAGKAYLILVTATDTDLGDNMIRCVTADDGQPLTVSPANMFPVQESQVPELIRKEALK